MGANKSTLAYTSFDYWLHPFKRPAFEYLVFVGVSKKFPRVRDIKYVCRIRIVNVECKTIEGPRPSTTCDTFNVEITRKWWFFFVFFFAFVFQEREIWHLKKSMSNVDAFVDQFRRRDKNRIFSVVKSHRIWIIHSYCRTRF